MEMRHPTIAQLDDSILVVIDCQKRLWKVITGTDALESSMTTLLTGARVLGVPALITEQNPKGLGPTVKPIAEAAEDASSIEKGSFACWGEPSFVSAVRELDRGTLVLMGVETHICILQTALGALAEGYRVHVVADCVGTREPGNQEIGLQRLRASGVVVTCVESVLFEWMQRCDADGFKAIVDLLK